MYELRSMIGQRHAARGLRSRLTPVDNALSRSQSSDSVGGPAKLPFAPSGQAESLDMKRLAESMQGLATMAEDNISNAASSHARLENDLRTLISAYEEVSIRRTMNAYK